MRFIIPLVAITFVASVFPNNSLSLVAYLVIALDSVFLAAGLLRKASPVMRRQIVIASAGAFVVALGIGAFFYLR